MKLLVLDNIDSFTYTLVDYLKQAGADCHIVRNTATLDEVVNIPCDGVVLSPGPGTPDQAGCLLGVIQHFHRQKPILGVCLGHQALGLFFGAELARAFRPMHGKLSEVIALRPDILLAQIPKRFWVTRYHSLLIQKLPSELIPLLVTSIGENMAFRHRELPIWGVQFHPEAVLTEYGLVLLKNWTTFVKTMK